MRELRQLLQRATKEQRRSLATLLDTKGSIASKIVDAFWWNSQSMFGWVLGSEPTYRDIVTQVATNLAVPHTSTDTTPELEVKIGQTVMRTVWERLDPAQRQEMEVKLREMAELYDGGALLQSGTVFAALTTAQLSGFGIYLLASTALGTVSGAVGLVLPFTVYATMSSAIATIIGPPGWIAAGLFAVWKLSGPNYKRLVPAVLYVAALRSSPTTVPGTRGWRMVGRCAMCKATQSYDLSHCNESLVQVTLRSPNDPPTMSGKGQCQVCDEWSVLVMPTHCDAPVQDLRLVEIQ